MEPHLLGLELIPCRCRDLFNLHMFSLKRRGWAQPSAMDDLVQQGIDRKERAKRKVHLAMNCHSEGS